MSKQRRSYTNQLHLTIKPIGYFVDLALDEHITAYDFFRIICWHIVPLIQASGFLAPLVGKWEKDLRAYQEEYSKATNNLEIEVLSTLKSLQAIIERENLHLDLSIKETFSFIDKTINFENYFQSVSPTWTMKLYEYIKQLCYRMIDLGRSDLLESYCKIVYIKKYVLNTTTQEKNLVEEPHVSSFEFAPSIEKLQELDAISPWNKTNDGYAAFQYLLMVKWCWEQKRDFFKVKNLKYNSAKACERSHHLHNIRSYWLETKTIKQRSKNHKSILLLKKDRFTTYLELVLSDIIAYQHSVYGEIDCSEEATIPYAISLIHIEPRLTLGVQWTEYDMIKYYKLHYCRYDSKADSFAINLFDTKKIYEFFPTSNFSKLGITGVLADLFLSKSKYYNTKRRLSTHVKLTGVKESKLKKLCKKISNMKPTTPPEQPYGYLSKEATRLRP